MMLRVGGRSMDLTSHVDKPARGRLTLLALAFALGIVLGRFQPEPIVLPWLMAGAALVILGVILRWWRPTWAVHGAAAAMIALGAAWYTVKHEHVPPNDLAAMLGEEPGMVRITGVAETSPSLTRRTEGSLAQFSYRNPTSYLPVRVDGLVDGEGAIEPIRGRVLVRTGEILPPFRAGDRVEAMGHLIPPQAPRNPGEFDFRELGKARGQAGWLSVPNRELLAITPRDQLSIYETWLDWRENLQRRAGGRLLSDLPETRSPERDALLKALLLGQREPDLDGLDESFQRLGVSHFLAISGLHLGILTLLVLLILRFFSGDRTWHGWALIALVLGYLILVEVRMPVLRAGLMTIFACAGLTFHRRLSASGLVSLAGLILLLIWPSQLFNAGFQLSFAVVLGLLHLSPMLRARWFGSQNHEAATFLQMLIEWGKNALVVAVTAWLIATPIVAYHFGIIAPLGIPLAVVATPLVAILLALGYAKIILTLILPSAALLVGIVLSLTADLVIAIVIAIDAIPGVATHVPFPSMWWTWLTLGFVWLWLAEPFRLPSAVWSGCFVGLALWLVAPNPFAPAPALRIDMISLGHGTCLILRSGGQTLVFDAGSISQLDAGNRWIIPAMRRIGVRNIDYIAISHPHIDHYSAVLELVDEFSPDRVLVTHQFIEHGREFPDTAVAYVSDQLIRRRIAPHPAITDREKSLGEARLTWLHPPKNLAEFGRDNEHSMVVLVEVAGRRVLLTGDVERAGLASLLANNPDLEVDVLEMPHHGAWHDLTGALLEQTRPKIVLQSSGRAQWERDRWQEVLDGIGATRLVTYRDGASWVEIARDGTITSGSFRNHN